MSEGLQFTYFLGSFYELPKLIDLNERIVQNSCKKVENYVHAILMLSNPAIYEFASLNLFTL